MDKLPRPNWIQINLLNTWRFIRMIVGNISESSALQALLYTFSGFEKKKKKKPKPSILTISYIRVQLLKTGCAQLQETELPMQLGAFISCHKTCFSTGIISISERCFRQVFLPCLCGHCRLHKVGCGFVSNGRCWFGIRPEHQGLG